MAPGRSVAALLPLLSLCLASGQPLQQADTPAPALRSYAAAPELEQQSSLARWMEPLLELALSRGVERVLAAGCRDNGDELTVLRARLEALEREVVELRRTAPPPTLPPPGRQPEPEPETGLVPQPGTMTGTTPEPRPEPKPEPDCESRPDPLAADLAPFERPQTLACSRSCLQLRDHMGTPQDGVYWFTGMPVPSLCDFTHDGGGWTLVLTAKSRDGWNLLSVLGRRETSPSLEDNYSILEHADAIRDIGNGSRFAYRIETQAEKGRQRWGGVWLAPREYSFVAETPDQTEVFVVKRFDKWTYKANGIKRRMPWLNMHVRSLGNDPTVLTTGDATTNVWGTLVRDEGNTAYQHSSWIHPESPQSGTVLYWVREGVR